MNKFLIALLLSSGIATAQVREVPLAIMMKDIRRKDWSDFDRMYLMTKVFHPGGSLGVTGDTINFMFDLPKSYTDSNFIIHSSNIFYDAVSVTSFHKDSQKQKIVKIDMCYDAKDCLIGFYDLKANKYQNSTIEEKLDIIAPAFYWPTTVGYYTDEHNKKTILLFHHIDPEFLYGKSYYLTSFNSYVILLIGDIMYKSRRKIRKQYADLINVFYAGDQMICSSRYSLNKNNLFPKIYGSKFYESFVIGKTSSIKQ